MKVIQMDCLLVYSHCRAALFTAREALVWPDYGVNYPIRQGIPGFRN